MANRTMTMRVTSEQHYNLGDVLHVNDERWVVIYTTYEGYDYLPYEITCELLSDFIAKSTYCSHIPEDSGTLADYIQKLCDEYEENCAS